MTTSQSTHDVVCGVIAEVIAEGGRCVVSIEGSHILRQDLQLDSLDLAVIVVRLEEKFRVDPFRHKRRQIRTVADLVDAYVEVLCAGIMIGKHLLNPTRALTKAIVVGEAGSSGSDVWTYEEIGRAATETASRLAECSPDSLIGIATEKASDFLIAVAAVEIADFTPVLLPATNCTTSRGEADVTLAALIIDGHTSGELSVQLYEPPATGSALPSDSVVLFTSGTSASPKPVIHTWETLSSAVRRAPPYHRRRWLLAYHPRTFAGMQVILQALLTEGTLYPAPNTPTDFWRHLLQSDIEYASATPSFWRAMLMEAGADVVGCSLRQITLGGEIADQHLLDQLRRQFPHADIAHIYASTEMGMCFSVRDSRAGFPASWLDDAPGGCEMRIAPDGELLLRSLHRMQRYLESECDLEHDQWFETGDLVELVGDRVQFRGRQGDAINVGGFKIQPRHIEEVIRPLPGVVDVCVYGIDSSLMGQLTAVKIQIGPICDAKRLRTNVVAACRESLPKHMIPAQVTLSLESIRDGDKIRRQQ